MEYLGSENPLLTIEEGNGTLGRACVLETVVV